MEGAPLLVYAEQMQVAQDVSVVLKNAREPSAAAITLGDSPRITVLVQAAPQWFGVRGAEGLAISDIRVDVGGRSIDRALASGQLALAPLDLRLPLRESARTYLSWAAILAGMQVSAASQALAQRFGFGAYLDKPLQSAPPHIRRAVVVAAAFLSGAQLLVLEDPLDGLPADVAEEFTQVLARALQGRRVLWLAPRIDAASPLASSCEEALWFHGSACVHRGPPSALSASDTYILSLRGPGDAFTDRLSADGVVATAIATGTSTSTSTWSVRTRETWRIFSAAGDVGATVTSLKPLGRASDI